MIRLAISVEGYTEEEFVKDFLANHLRERGVEPTPIRLGSAHGRSAGGNVSMERLVRDMSLLRHSFNAVTSLVDFYGFRRKGDKTVDELEEDLRQKLGHPWYPEKVIPYVQRHEFEGLLFSDVSVFAGLIEAPDGSVEALQNIRSQFQTPEDINDNKDTAPSKRIKKVLPQYNKEVNAPLLAVEIGLDKIRTECPRFNDWVTSLESLGS
ncbi:MAG: DUF4276 family protein [Gemmatimonadota bacterium]|nr:DUF4276 family protein [Gemmatimonadota bacterium]